MSAGAQLRIHPIFPGDIYGSVGMEDNWRASWDEKEGGACLYDGAGPTVELALVSLVRCMGDAIEAAEAER